MSFMRKGRQIIITLPRRRTVIKISLAIALIVLAVGGTVAYLTRPVEVLRDIRTPFEIDFTENLQGILLVYENGTLIKPTRIGGHGGEAPMRAYFDAPVLFHFHAYAPFYNQSAIYDPWTTVGRNSLTFLITFNNQTRITYEHLVEEGCPYTPDGYTLYYFHVKPGVIL
jgi:hypothetical protein